ASVDDAAVENPESGDTPDAATASSGDGTAATSSASTTSAGPAAADDAAAHPVEPLAEAATPDAPLPPGLDSQPAPVKDLDSGLPPGTILR
ncbi:MAG TPA: hypothetical protein VFS20_17900, partial [Longimicrobium sp.]|nr:hypothetical protein [Longimicrobium sp.]